MLFSWSITSEGFLKNKKKNYLIFKKQAIMCVYSMFLIIVDVCEFWTTLPLLWYFFCWYLSHDFFYYSMQLT